MEIIDNIKNIAKYYKGSNIYYRKFAELLFNRSRSIDRDLTHEGIASRIILVAIGNIEIYENEYMGFSFTKIRDFVITLYAGRSATDDSYVVVSNNFIYLDAATSRILAAASKTLFFP